MNRKLRERGSATIEALMVVPVIAVFFALTVLGGRLAITHQAVQAAAADAARSASIARTASAASFGGQAAGYAGLANQGLTCSPAAVRVDTSQFNRPVGTPATITATISCHVPTSDLSLPGVPGTMLVEASQTSPLDTYRER
ncbi:TadE/TadG family type IV pilus assembly protein [Propioniciclava soli]|uniref:TadE/TadG family type IV pilus assembly protein n=1 Tax=Propioniciclava soli TaxID=2775081 RepID=UPI001E2C93CC|nr:TadE/TadG family type IV pilus assembly protein [Propioniciclava soli]